MSVRIDRLLPLLLLVVGGLGADSARAQDLYDPGVLRRLDLQFHDADWLARLRSNYASETLIYADLEVDGTTYPDVGVRIRGNTSYTSLPVGSQKFSLKVELDVLHPGQTLYGYDELNLNNGFRDPTFTREVVYNNYVAQFIPNPRANHVVLSLNGENWGVYINVQQPDKRMLRDYFTNADGLRVVCANQPNGPGLRYNGPNPSGYAIYQINNDGGLADPWGALIAVTDALSNFPLGNWAAIDQRFAIDPSIWSVVLENALTDDDSYVNKGCDFLTYRDPLDGRMHLLQRDANETFSQVAWSPTRNFGLLARPVMNRLLSVPELRQRYFSHYRRVLQDMQWSQFGPVFAAHRALIEAEVMADTRKLYSHALFDANFTQTVNMPLPGLAGGSIVGLQPFIEQRRSFLEGTPELIAAGPTILAVQASSTTPDPGEQVWITADVVGVGGAVASVEVFYRPSIDSQYLRLAMADDGESNDGAAGDGLFGARLPVAGNSGQRVDWYVGAVSGNAFASSSFLPVLAERGPERLTFGLGVGPPIRITEFMYSGAGGEFIELTNVGIAAIDITGWSIDDDHAVPGAFDISAAGVLLPGASVVITESDAATFRASWGIAESVTVIGQLGLSAGNNLGRNDQIHVFDAAGSLVDRLDYGDQTFPGSIRTQNRSGQPPCSALGANAISEWQLSTVGDAFGSLIALSGDIGRPGSFDAAPCQTGTFFADGFEAPLAGRR